MTAWYERHGILPINFMNEPTIPDDEIVWKIRPPAIGDGVLIQGQVRARELLFTCALVVVEEDLDSTYFEPDEVVFYTMNCIENKLTQEIYPNGYGRDDE